MRGWTSTWAGVYATFQSNMAGALLKEEFLAQPAINQGAA